MRDSRVLRNDAQAVRLLRNHQTAFVLRQVVGRQRSALELDGGVQPVGLPVQINNGDTVVKGIARRLPIFDGVAQFGVDQHRKGLDSQGA